MVGGQCVCREACWKEACIMVGGRHVVLCVCKGEGGVGGNGWLCACACVLLAYMQKCESAMICVGKASWVWQKRESL